MSPQKYCEFCLVEILFGLPFFSVTAYALDCVVCLPDSTFSLSLSLSHLYLCVIHASFVPKCPRGGECRKEMSGARE